MMGEEGIRIEPETTAAVAVTIPRRVGVVHIESSSTIVRAPSILVPDHLVRPRNALKLLASARVLIRMIRDR